MITQNKKYHHYTNYIFKKTIHKRAAGVLKFLNIPYKIKNFLITEITDDGPQIHRLDFAGEVEKQGEEIILILECQTKLPTDEDILRFFQYVSSLRIMKKAKLNCTYCLQKKHPTQKENLN